MKTSETEFNLGDWGAGIVVAAGRLVISPLRKVWRRLWVGPRVELDLAWDRAPIIIPGEPTPVWRAVKVTVTAAKYEQFVFAKGNVQVRGAGQWKWGDVAKMKDFLLLPITVAPNQQEDVRISASSLLKQVPSEIRGKPFEIRVSLRDHHRTRITSNPLLVDEAELLREGYS